jgi:hypothetical protein
MANTEVVLMRLETRGEPGRRALEELRAQLPNARIDDPDEQRVFEIEVEADSLNEALLAIWHAVGAAGVDDHIVFMEHPQVPEHWRDAPAGRFGDKHEEWRDEIVRYLAGSPSDVSLAGIASEIGAHPKLVEALVDDLIERGRLTREGDRLVVVASG